MTPARHQDELRSIEPIPRDEEATMRRIRYGVAASLDGYIAGPNGEYDWIPIDPEIDFSAMFAQFDTLLMGRRTYEKAAANRGGNMSGMDVWVFSRTLEPADHPGVTVVGDDVQSRLQELRSRSGKDIALHGGGALFRSLLEMGQVDGVEVAVVPVLLGGGIPLLPPSSTGATLVLTRHHVYQRTGTVLLEYAVQRPSARQRRVS